MYVYTYVGTQTVDVLQKTITIAYLQLPYVIYPHAREPTKQCYYFILNFCTAYSSCSPKIRYIQLRILNLKKQFHYLIWQNTQGPRKRAQSTRCSMKIALVNETTSSGNSWTGSLCIRPIKGWPGFLVE